MGKMVLIRHIWKTIHSAKTVATHDYFNAFMKSKNDIESLLNERGKKISDANILILGCGYNYPDVILWSTVAKQVIGIDVREAFWKDGFMAKYKDLRRGGRGIFGAFANTIVNRLTYFGYFDELRNLSHLQLDENNQNLKTYDGSNLPFSNETFDVVCSNAVLEHIKPNDLSHLTNEISRVTQSSGISYHCWHNYYSLSGAHVPDEIASTHPWGHLLGDSAINSYLNISKTYLNRMLPEEIMKFLSNDFRSMAVYSLDKNHNKFGNVSEFAYEGEELLTKELETKLANYTRNTLLTRSFLFVGEKKVDNKEKNMLNEYISE